MRIQIPAILTQLRLADYAPELGDQVLVVWVNPPSGLLREYDERFGRVYNRNQAILALPDSPASKKKAAELLEENQPDVDRMLEIVSQLLSAGTEETRVSPADLNGMIEDLADANPGFYLWLVGRVFGLVGEYRQAQKKS